MIENPSSEAKIPELQSSETPVLLSDPNAPSTKVSSKRQSLSDIFTIVRFLCPTHINHTNTPQLAAGAALISDGYFNNTMTMINVLLKKEYPLEYTTTVSTRVSNALLVGEIFGQVAVGLTCDYLGRKFAIIMTTLMIVVGGILATASHGVTTNGYFLYPNICRSGC
jgi:MFS family permease